MRHSLLAATVLAGALALPSVPAQAAIDVDLHIGNTYPVHYQRMPRAYVIPSSDVYYVPAEGYDMFRYGARWYINDGGVWFSASTYRGPFVRVAFESVPRVVLQVPPRYHHESRGYWAGRSWHDNGRHEGWNRGRGHDRDRDDD